MSSLWNDADTDAGSDARGRDSKVKAMLATPSNGATRNATVVLGARQMRTSPPPKATAVTATRRTVVLVVMLVIYFKTYL